ncbi:hypothetical protein [Streptomyces bungoensis]|uniref:hypothetical protein n=1 Tax=Streptomyces bungoensis TaxID=285568 RepID=UPI0033E6E39B
MRVLRTAAGRRALQLALLVGGLLLLGFLCGEQAHAAERTPAAATTSAAPVTSAGAVTSTVQATSTGLLPAGQRDAVRQVAERVVTPVRDVVDTATRTLRQVGTQVQTQTRPPSVDLPELPETTEPLPTQPLPVDPLPTPARPRPHLPGTTAPAPAPHPVQAEGGHVRAESRTAAPARPSATAYGPDAVPGGLAPHAPAPAPAARHTAVPTEAPAAPAPSGDPDGTLGKQAADGTASRHGDPHAVTLDGRAPLRLLPGTAAHADAPRIRERHRDIPVFPG